MSIIQETIVIKNKKIPLRIHTNSNPKYIFVTLHGLLSSKTSWRYFEKWIDKKAVVISYDARQNGENNLRASRMSSTYVKDLRDIVRWVKKEYEDHKIVILGSSWGAVVATQYAKKYGDEVFKIICWSIPYNLLSGNDHKNSNEKLSKTKETLKVKKGIQETSLFGYAWRFSLMLLFNINTKSYTKIDLDKTTNNIVISRINNLSKPKSTSVKLFWACAKSIILANKNLAFIDKKYIDKPKMLYIQSLNDSYLTPKKLKTLKTIKKGGVDVRIIKEGKHAFQWETDNDFNIRIFQFMFDWLSNKKESKIKRI